MLDGVKNAKLYREWLDFIVDPDVKGAFLHLIGLAACSTRFACHIQWKGDVRDFRFHEMTSGEQPHSFITNQHWLLFYFRPSAIRAGYYVRTNINGDLDSFTETPASEWHVKLRSIADVQRLSQHIRWHAI